MTATDQRAAASAGERARERWSSAGLGAAMLALPALALVLLGFGLVLAGGGVAPEQWEPVAVGVAVCVALLAAIGALPAPPRAAWPPLAALALYVGWCALSLWWSEDQAATLENVARVSLLFSAMLVGATFAARARAALTLAVVLALCGALLACAVELNLLLARSDVVQSTRLSWPISYANGSAAALWLALPALVVLAAQRPLRPLLRGLVGGFAGLALATGLIAQSRGGILALAAALAACVLLAASRGRMGLTVLAIVAPAVPAAAVLARSTSSISPRERGLVALAVAVVAAVLVGLLAAADWRDPFPFGGRQERIAARVGLAGLAVAVVLFAALAGRPDTWLQHRWDEFSRPPVGSQAPTATHFGTGVSNRYDYWRVAMRAFADHPLSGVGSGAFAVPWYRLRRIDENVSDAHSWEAGALAETGVIGFVLLAGGVLLPFRSMRRRTGSGELDCALLALTGCAVYLVAHASSDWVLRIPGVAIVGMVVLGALAAGGRQERFAFVAGGARAASAVAALAVAAIVCVPYLATRQLSHAESEPQTANALSGLRLAADINPFDPAPLLARAQIYLQAGQARQAVAAAREAVERSPDNWPSWAQLSLAELAARDGIAQHAAWNHALRLNPRLPPSG